MIQNKDQLLYDLQSEEKLCWFWCGGTSSFHCRMLEKKGFIDDEIRE